MSENCYIINIWCDPCDRIIETWKIPASFVWLTIVSGSFADPPRDQSWSTGPFRGWPSWCNFLLQGAFVSPEIFRFFPSSFQVLELAPLHFRCILCGQDLEPRLFFHYLFVVDYTFRSWHLHLNNTLGFWNFDYLFHYLFVVDYVFRSWHLTLTVAPALFTSSSSSDSSWVIWVYWRASSLWISSEVSCMRVVPSSSPSCYTCRRIVWYQEAHSYVESQLVAQRVSTLG